MLMTLSIWTFVLQIKYVDLNTLKYDGTTSYAMTQTNANHIA